MNCHEAVVDRQTCGIEYFHVFRAVSPIVPELPP